MALSSPLTATEDPSRAGDRTLSLAGILPPVETPSQRDQATTQEERGVVIFVDHVPMILGESSNLT